MRLKLLAPFALAVLLLLVLGAVRDEFLAPELYDFGRSLNPPTPGFGRFLAVWTLFGSLAAGLLAISLVRLAAARGLASRFADAADGFSDRKWMLYGTVFAFLVPAALRTFLLQGTPLTDDASAYRFMAEVLASGRVYADSPPLKLFFDNRFMINDGRFYAHFFLGWPALLVPGVWLGVTGFMSALCSALTVPALFLVLRRLVGSAWARAGIALYLVSPMLMVVAATETAHTSCIAALAWFTWFVLRSRDPGAPWWSHAGAALAFATAFFIRPTSALGVGLPLLVVWALGALRLWASPRRFWAALVAFALPAAVMAALFLTVNKLQTGSYLEVAYQRAYTYAQENDFRFALWPEEVEGGAFTEFRVDDVARSLAVAGSALYRLNVSLLGWPCSLLFALFAVRGPLAATLWLSVLSYLGLHFFTDNVGVDTFAPMHYVELAWPLLLLNVAGLARLAAAGGRVDDLLAKQRGADGAEADTAVTAVDAGWRWRRLPGALAAALVAVACVSYVPVRFGVIKAVAENVAMPWRGLEAAGIKKAIVFTPDPFIYYCRQPPVRGWVFVRPNNDPKLENDLLWANHLSVEKNKVLMRRFPDREGYVMAWDRSCKVVFLPLARITPGSIPDAEVSGLEEIGE